MSTNAPKGGKTTASSREAQTDCQDERCPYGDLFKSAARAQVDAHDHADLTGHDVRVEAPEWSRPLTVVGVDQ